jgi:hypothetical protein
MAFLQAPFLCGITPIIVYTSDTMNNLLSLTSNQLKRAAAIKDQIEGLNQELASLLGSAAPAPKAAGKTSKKGTMSAAGRARVAAAQRARWAKLKAGKSAATVAGKPAAKKKKFTMSAAAKAKISAAAKARWAKVKSAKKA